LLEFLPPARGKIAIEVEAVARTLHSQRVAVVALVAAFGKNAVIRAAGFRRLAAHHQPRLLRVRLPQPVRILDAHLQDAPVAVDVLDDQSLDFVLVERIRPRARAHPPRLFGERPLGTVGIDARAHVERARIERARDVGVATVLRQQRVHEMQCCRRRRDFRRMDIAVDPERRLVGCGAGRSVGEREHPDVAAFVTLADRLDRDESGVLARGRVQKVGELGVAVEAVEGKVRHVARWIACR
jgi:hypothetical protein